jgi:hypothetical protein
MKMILIAMSVWDCVDSPSGTTATDTKRDQRALARICLNVKTLIATFMYKLRRQQVKRGQTLAKLMKIKDC